MLDGEVCYVPTQLVIRLSVLDFLKAVFYLYCFIRFDGPRWRRAFVASCFQVELQPNSNILTVSNSIIDHRVADYKNLSKT